MAKPACECLLTAPLALVRENHFLMIQPKLGNINNHKVTLGRLVLDRDAVITWSHRSDVHELDSKHSNTFSKITAGRVKIKALVIRYALWTRSSQTLLKNYIS